MTYDNGTTTELTTAECWQALRADELGRLAFRLGDEINLVPINYAVDGETLLFRTAEGDKLLGVVMHHEVVFEIDRLEGEQATSVVVRGEARRLEEDEAHRADNLPLRPWVGLEKYNVVEIRPTAVTGRRFEMHRPWLHARAD